MRRHQVEKSGRDVEQQGGWGWAGKSGRSGKRLGGDTMMGGRGRGAMDQAAVALAVLIKWQQITVHHPNGRRPPHTIGRIRKNARPAHIFG